MRIMQVWVFLEFLICLIDSILLYIFVKRYSERLTFHKADLAVMAAVALISFLRVHFGVSRFVSPLIGIFISWCMCIYCRIKPLKSLITALLYFVFIEISEIFVMGILVMVLNDRYDSFAVLPVFNLIAILTSRIVFIAVACGKKTDLQLNLSLRYQAILTCEIVMIALCMESMCIIAVQADAQAGTRLILTFTSLVMFGIIFVIIYLFNSLSLYYTRYYESREIAHALQANQELYENVSLNNEQTRRTVHDYKNHIFTAMELLKQDKIKQTMQYLSDISGKLDKPYKSYLHNNIADIVINHKMAYAQKARVFLTVEGVMGQVNIRQIDICSLISNMLDNAIEAAEKCSDGFVKLKAKMQGDYLYISTINSVVQKPEIIGDIFVTAKADKENHGIGIKIIQDIVNKYNGEFYFNYEDNTVSVSVLLKPLERVDKDE